MDKYTHIVSLIDQLLNDSLSLEELSELQQLFHSAEAKGDVEMWFAHLWESSGMQKDCSIDSANMLRRLNEKILLAERVHIAGKDKNSRIFRLMRPLMRYAAVFMLAMAFSWFWFGREKLPEIQNIDDNNNFAGVSEVSVTYGSKSRIVLPDSSEVYLNSGSQLSYPAVFDGERHVSLTGEGYFIVRSDTLHPFLVHTADVSVKATGTEFNVKAYPEEGRVETVLVSGTVEIIKKGQSKPIVELKPGEKGSFVKGATTVQQLPDADAKAADAEKEQPQMVLSIVKKPDVATGWVKNQLIFDAEPFEQIAVKLERWFNVEIEICDATLAKTRLTGRYDTENIEQVMHSLKMATPFSYNIEKNKIIIK